MAPLHPPPARAAPAHRDIETAHYGAPDNLFLILCFAALRLHAPAAMRTVRRQWNRDPFIYARRDGAACLPAVATARVAAWPLRIGFWPAPPLRVPLTATAPHPSPHFPPHTLLPLFP